MQFFLKYRSSTLSNVGLANLFIVYIIWSSTYLAIRVGMAEGSGLSLLAMGTIRLLLAGAILLGYSAIRKHRVRITGQEVIFLIITSIFMWVINFGCVMWAEQRAGSGFAALIVSTSPIMVAFLDSLLLRRTPSKLLLGSLLFSFCGLGLLMAPSLLQGKSTDFVAGIALLLCALSWSIGTVYQSRNSIDLPITVISGYQHLIGGGIFGLLMLVFQEPLPHPTAQAWIALWYLIIFGSVLAFTAFITALKLLPINIAMTYAYVNPVLALFLGWWLLDEPITGWTLVGAAMVILGIVGVFKNRSQTPHLRDKEAVKMQG